MPRYISEILNYEADLKLGTTELDFLHRFLKGTCSVYGIYTELANQYVLRQDGNILSENVHIFQRLDSSLLGKGMAYKNVHKRIKRLAELNLIQEFDHKYPGTHGAKFYRITRKGLFFLIYSSRLDPRLIRLDDLIQYHGDPVLETILFPYFEDKSLSWYTPAFHFAISFYLAECCDTILDAVKDIKEEEERDVKRRSIALLEYNLKRNALSLANKLVNKFNPRALGYLAGDKNFVKLAKELKAEFDNGYYVFISEATKRGIAS